MQARGWAHGQSSHQAGYPGREAGPALPGPRAGRSACSQRLGQRCTGAVPRAWASLWPGRRHSYLLERGSQRPPPPTRRQVQAGLAVSRAGELGGGNGARRRARGGARRKGVGAGAVGRALGGGLAGGVEEWVESGQKGSLLGRHGPRAPAGKRGVGAINNQACELSAGGARERLKPASRGAADRTASRGRWAGALRKGARVLHLSLCILWSRDVHCPGISCCAAGPAGWNWSLAVGGGLESAVLGWLRTVTGLAARPSSNF